MDIRLTPGTAGLAICSIKLFGLERVDPGEVFTSAVYINGLTEEEVQFAEEFFGEIKQFPVTVTRITEKTP